mmetsp:Transcript_21614/g.51208  ORF Transcript_21614/g.51208 Transcript_21614/m.51208 type:complete len:109 (-) Transcript_21614:16-342(-)
MEPLERCAMMTQQSPIGGVCMCVSRYPQNRVGRNGYCTVRYGTEEVFGSGWVGIEGFHSHGVIENHLRHGRLEERSNDWSVSIDPTSKSPNPTESFLASIRESDTNEP